MEKKREIGLIAARSENNVTDKAGEFIGILNYVNNKKTGFGIWSFVSGYIQGCAIS